MANHRLPVWMLAIVLVVLKQRRIQKIIPFRDSWADNGNHERERERTWIKSASIIHFINRWNWNIFAYTVTAIANFISIRYNSNDLSFPHSSWHTVLPLSRSHCAARVYACCLCIEIPSNFEVCCSCVFKTKNIESVNMCVEIYWNVCVHRIFLWCTGMCMCVRECLASFKSSQYCRSHWPTNALCMYAVAYVFVQCTSHCVERHSL